MIHNTKDTQLNNISSLIHGLTLHDVSVLDITFSKEKSTTLVS